MHQHYDAAYRFQASGNAARADVEHILFVTEALNHLANFYANTGDYQHANPVYDEALRLSPNDFGLLMDYAGASLDAHEPQKAEALLQAVKRLDKKATTARQEGDVHLMHGRALLALGDTKSAIEEFRAALAIDPNIDTYSALAGAVLDQDGYAAAAPIFAKIVARFGDSAAVHMRNGLTCARAGSHDRAIAEFKKAIAQDYKLPDLHYSLGAAYLNNLASDLPLAEAEFRKEVALHPEDTFSYPQLGKIALRRLDYKEAEFDFKRAAISTPLNADVFASLGKVYADTGRPMEAEAAFRKAIALTIDISHDDYAIERVHYQLGRLLFARGNEVEGERELEIAQELLLDRGRQAEVKLAGKSTLHSLDRTRVAMPKELKELNLFAKQIGPLIASSYNNLGVHAAMGGQFQIAAGYFSRASQWDPSLAGVDRNWARAAYAAQDCAQAIGPLNRAVLSLPSDTDLAAMLHQCRNVLQLTPQQ